MPTITTNLSVLAVGCAIALALGACATPSSVPIGAMISDVKSSTGNPTATWPLPDGGTRLQYSSQPAGQTVWNLDFNAKGQMVSREQALTDATFARIVPGRTTQADVLRDFGRPADIQTFPLKQQSSFMYRYTTYGGFSAAMFVNFDPAGVVVGTQTGLDPWQLGGPGRK